MEGSSGNGTALISNPSLTLNQTRLSNCFISQDLRPQNDPDSPPYMALIDNSTEDNSMGEFNKYTDYILEEIKQQPNRGLECRDRIYSADWQYSILAFLNRKIRERVMSQQLKCSNHF